MLRNLFGVIRAGQTAQNDADAPAHQLELADSPAQFALQTNFEFLEIDRDAPHTLIYYESPHRLGATLRDALAVFGDRPAAIANDLTKRFEVVQRGTLAQLGDLAAGSRQ